MGKNAHILCIETGGDAGFVPKHGFAPFGGRLAEALRGDLWIGPRAKLEKLVARTVDRDPLDAIARMAKGMSSGSGLGGRLADLLGGEASISSIMGIPVDETAAAYPSHLQIIPYFLFRYRGRYLRYVRTVAGGDERLHGKVSAGIGGHVDLTDAKVDGEGAIDLEATLGIAGAREAREEIGIDVAPDAFAWVGTIYATETEVDRVHVGVVGLYDLNDAQAEAIDANQEIGEHSFLTFREIAEETRGDDAKTLETWTRLIIESNPLA